MIALPFNPWQCSDPTRGRSQNHALYCLSVSEALDSLKVLDFCFQDCSFEEWVRLD